MTYFGTFKILLNIFEGPVNNQRVLYQTNKRMKKLILVLICAFSMTAVHAQKNKYTIDKTTGLEYVIFSPKKGERIADGKIVFLNLRYKTNRDSVIFDTWTMHTPIQIPVSQSAFKGDLMDALRLLTVGDSASFLINADSLFEKTFGVDQLPDFIDKGSKLNFTVKIDRVTSPEEMQAEELKIQKEKEMEEKVHIDKYISDNKLQVITTSSGLMYVMLTEGTGKQAVAGKSVRVHYTGKLLDGTKFDSSFDRNDPIEFTLGQGMVIRGWDEGIALLKEGGKALLIIPSNLGYGARGAGGIIPPFTPLTFEVELVSIAE